MRRNTDESTVSFFLELASICQRRGMFFDEARYREYASDIVKFGSDSWEEGEENGTDKAQGVPRSPDDVG